MTKAQKILLGRAYKIILNAIITCKIDLILLKDIYYLLEEALFIEEQKNKNHREV